MKIVYKTAAPITFNDVEIGELFMFSNHVYMSTGFLHRHVGEERYTSNTIEMDTGRFRLFKGNEEVKKVKGTLIIQEEEV